MHCAKFTSVCVWVWMCVCMVVFSKYFRCFHIRRPHYCCWCIIFQYNNFKKCSWSPLEITNRRGIIPCGCNNSAAIREIFPQQESRERLPLLNPRPVQHISLACSLTSWFNSTNAWSLTYGDLMRKRSKNASLPVQFQMRLTQHFREFKPTRFVFLL